MVHNEMMGEVWCPWSQRDQGSGIDIVATWLGTATVGDAHLPAPVPPRERAVLSTGLLPVQLQRY
jgi:hypothetical protein